MTTTKTRGLPHLRVGARVVLVHTDDPYTKLKPGDEGTVNSITELPAQLGGDMQIWVSWDNGSGLALVEGKDQYVIVE